MRIAFIWQGVSGRYGNDWGDGLYAAMKRIEKEHDVRYIEPGTPVESDEVVLYWEAPCTLNGKDADNYRFVQNLPNKKALFFAGGPMEAKGLIGFDHIFVESKINSEELSAMGITHSTAFGINEEIFKPMNVKKSYDGIMQATFAGWKRQPLFAEALGKNGVLVGRYQEQDQDPWNRSEQAVRLPHLNPESVAVLLNASHVAVNTSEYWGGGQRCTLEAMACGVPVVVMSDSPKNREYVEESGCGVVCDPNPEAIRQAVEQAKEIDGRIGVEYVKGKWTSEHYANNILAWINTLN